MKFVDKCEAGMPGSGPLREADLRAPFAAPLLRPQALQWSGCRSG